MNLNVFTSKDWKKSSVAKETYQQERKVQEELLESITILPHQQRERVQQFLS